MKILCFPARFASLCNMTVFAPLRRNALLRPPFLAAALAAAFAFSGCDDVEDANPDGASTSLSPASSFSVVQSPRPRDEASSSTNVVNGVTNVVTTLSPAQTINSLSIASSSSGDSAWNVQASDNLGHSWSGSASGPSILSPGADNAYAAGSSIASFSLQCPGLSGSISVVALASIPMEIVRTSSTNGDSVAVGRRGRHSISPANAEYRLAATAVVDGKPYSLSGSSPSPSAEILW